MPRPFPRAVHALGVVLAVVSAAVPVAIARAAEPPAVVVSIAPVQSLTAAVMEGAGTPRLLLPAGTSPHTTALRPSDALAMSRAKLVVWVGPMLEMALVKPIGALARGATVLELAHARGVMLLKAREGGVWEADADVPVPDRAGARAGAGLDTDPHIWLDPDNAAAMVRAIAAALARVDPGRAKLYAANARRAAARIATLDHKLAARLAPVRHVPFIVFHDAYQYFERHYGLTAVGSVTVAPGRAPGAQRLLRLRARLRATHAACVFAEPQFEPRIIRTLTEGTDARTGVLDPLGAALTPGAGLYGKLMEALADSLVRCLARR